MLRLVRLDGFMIFLKGYFFLDFANIFLILNTVKTRGQKENHSPWTIAGNHQKSWHTLLIYHKLHCFWVARSHLVLSILADQLQVKGCSLNNCEVWYCLNKSQPKCHFKIMKYLHLSNVVTATNSPSNIYRNQEERDTKSPVPKCLYEMIL